MVRDLIIRPKAEVELTDAFNGYEDTLSGLGSDYLNTVEAALSGIQRPPTAFPVAHGDIRRYLIRRFPCAA